VITGPPEALARMVRATARRLDGRVWLVADRNTASAAPEVTDALATAVGATILPGVPPVVPRIELSQQIAEESAKADARALVVIGGGTLTDLAKHAAHLNRIDVISVPSAASVDAYNSARSALRIEGYHRTPEARVPSVILACPDLIESAPEALTLSGLGDLVAKLLARLDWQVSALITDETFSLRDTEWSARAARHALARLRYGGLDEAAFAALDALLVTGRAMRVFGSSRPAASSEHTIAHLWEVALEEQDAHHYHGLLVAEAAGHVVRAYRWVLGRLTRSSGERLVDVAEIASRNAGWSDRAPDDMQPFLDKMREESADRSVTATSVAEHRDRITAANPQIIALAERTLDDAERGLETLREAGLNRYLPEIPHHWVARSLQWVKYLRNRYSMFDLAFEMGWEPELLEYMGATDA